jgi:hypothetical protein
VKCGRDLALQIYIFVLVIDDVLSGIRFLSSLDVRHEPVVLLAIVLPTIAVVVLWNAHQLPDGAHPVRDISYCEQVGYLVTLLRSHEQVPNPRIQILDVCPESETL